MGSGRSSMFHNAETMKRALRTLFFMVIMALSFVVSSAPLLVSIMDVMTPCILLSTFACCSSCFRINHELWMSYSFRTSLMDIPLMSLIRSLAILCVYSVCGIPKLTYGPYLSTTAICAAASAVILVIKAFILADHDLSLFYLKPTSRGTLQMRYAWGVFSLFSCSMALALGHIIVAYKVKCQAQRKMHLYRLDPEAIYSLKTFLYAHVNDQYKKQAVDFIDIKTAYPRKT